MRQITCIVIGAGSRGTTYANYFFHRPEAGKIIAVAEPREHYRVTMVRNHQIDSANVVQDWRELANRPKFADAVIIATPDQFHLEPAAAFAAKGYDMLLEKPLAPNEQDCERIVQAAIDNKIKLCVCHVLRYTAYTQQLKKMLDSGIIGDIVNIEHFEPVGYWHQAHSFVRGNSRNTALQSFMLLQKSCHDIDWLRYIVGKKTCINVASFGSLKHFKAEHRPAGAAVRCVNCAVEPTCPYSAVKIYIRDRINKGDLGWPVDVLTSDLTVDGVMNALRTGPYGRCVYACDNDVVDHQVAILSFEDDITVSFTMTAFCRQSDRKTRIFGTLGQLEGDGERIVHYDFLTDKTETHEVTLPDSTIPSGHGGGDYGMMEAFIKAVSLNDSSYIISGAHETLATHKIVFATERARLENRVINL